jgi:glycine/D-amino acid oxidase-like deaminating enzyme
MIMSEIDTPLSKLVEAIGAANAHRAWLRSVKAVENLAARIRDAEIACSFERRSSLLVTGDEMGWRALKAESELRTDAGLRAEFLDRSSVLDRYGIDRTGAIVSNSAASANPARMTAGFLRDAARKGAELVAGPDVVEIDAKGGSITLTFSDDSRIDCGYAVFCTGYEFLKRLSRLDHDVVSTWAIATRPDTLRPEWLDRFLVWEASDPYLYLRTTRDGRIIAGGEDEKDENAHRSTAKLERKARIIAEKVAALLAIEPPEVDHAWAGPFGVTPNGLPVIGKVPGLANVFTVMGYGGNGITFSQIASEIVSAQIDGRADPDETLFSAEDGRSAGGVA